MANISQNVNIEMLEKLPDGTYKRKYPKTRSDTGVTFDEHLAENATQAHLAKNIELEDTGGNFVATEVEGAMQELFTNVSSGKDLVGGAITGVDENVVIPTDPTFQELADGVNNISVGDYKIGDSIDVSNITIEYGNSLPASIYKTIGGSDPINILHVKNGFLYSGYTSYSSYSGRYYYSASKFNLNGDKVWDWEASYTINDSVVIGVVVDNNDNVYVATDDRYNKFYKVDSSGNLVFETGSTGDYMGSMVIDNVNSCLYGYSTRSISKRDFDGNVIWEFDISDNIINAIDIDSSGYIYTGENGGYVRKVDPNDGSTVWEVRRGTGNIRSIKVNEKDNVVFTRPSYIETCNSDGDLVSSEYGRNYGGKDIGTYGDDIFVSNSNTIYKINGTDVLWSYQLDSSRSVDSLTYEEGILFVSYARNIEAFEEGLYGIKSITINN